MQWIRARLHHDDPQRGAAALELAIAALFLLPIIGLIIAAGRTAQANSTVSNAASNASRAASISRNAGTAQSAAAAAAATTMRQAGLHCTPSTSVDTSGFGTSPGQAAVVQVTVSCNVGLSDLAVPGLPGSKTFTASSTSPIDTYRER